MRMRSVGMPVSFEANFFASLQTVRGIATVDDGNGNAHLAPLKNEAAGLEVPGFIFPRLRSVNPPLIM